MSITLFPNMLRDTFTEADDVKAKSNLESYTGIVFDTKKNAFSVITGLFRDKKDMYHKMTKADKYLRRAYETKIWDWIQENADNPIDAYLMLSTAVSKWMNNNVLSKYYKKLLHDLPYINREGRKGDPQTMGKKASFESTENDEDMLVEGFVELTEGFEEIEPKIKEVMSKAEEAGLTRPHDVKVYPVDENGELIHKDVEYFPKTQLFTSKMSFDPELSPQKLSDKSILKYNRDKLFNPLFYRSLAVKLNDSREPLSKYNKFAIVIDNDYTNAIPEVKNDIFTRYFTFTQKFQQDPEYFIKSDKSAYSTANTAYQSQKRQLSNMLQSRNSEEPVDDALLNRAKKDFVKSRSTLSRIAKMDADEFELSPEDQEKVKELRNKISALANEPLPDNIEKGSDEAWNWNNERLTKIKELNSQIKDFRKEKADYHNSIYGNTTANKEKAREKHWNLTKPISYGNPIHNSGAENEFIDKHDKREKEDRWLNSQLNKAIRNGDFRKERELRNILKKESVQTEAYVNDGASALKYSTDNMDKQNVSYVMEGQTHEELNQELFDGKTLKSDVRDALLDIANTFKANLKLDIEPIDIYFTGSEANYNYNDNSDIDLHLVYDFENAGMNAELLSKYLQTAKKVFNNQHDITIKGLPVEVGAENTSEPLVTSGIYSVLNDSWVIEPENAGKELIEPEDDYYMAVKTALNDIINSKDKNMLANGIEAVWNMRKSALADGDAEEGGELGYMNNLFKKLRADGILERLKQAYYNAESEELSLESLEEGEFDSIDSITYDENDLFEKSKNEIIDGLMAKYAGNIDETLNKLEDVLANADDGYREAHPQISEAIEELRNKNSFGDRCKFIFESALRGLKEWTKKTPAGTKPESYVNHLKDIAKVDEMLSLTYMGIHPDFKYKKPYLAYDKKDGSEGILQLGGIDEGDDPQNVLCYDIDIVEADDGKYRPTIVDRFEMPTYDFVKVTEDPRNKEMHDKILRNEPDLDDLLIEIEERARNINEAYRNWCIENWDKYDLNTLPARYRVALYHDIAHYGWRPELALKKWEGSRKKKEQLPGYHPTKGKKKTESVEEIEEAFGEREKQDYVKASENGRYVTAVLDRYLHIDPKLLQVPFAVEPDNSKWKREQDKEPTRYYVIVGVERTAKPEDVNTVYITQTDNKGKTIKGKRAEPVPAGFIQAAMAWSATHNKLNDPSRMKKRALMQLTSDRGRSRISKVDSRGTYITLSDDEVEAVLKIMEKEDPRFENLVKYYNQNPNDPAVIMALKAFDPDFASYVKHMSNGYKLFVPYGGKPEEPVKFKSNQPLRDLRRWG